MAQAKWRSELEGAPPPDCDEETLAKAESLVKKLSLGDKYAFMSTMGEFAAPDPSRWYEYDEVGKMPAKEVHLRAVRAMVRQIQTGNENIPISHTKPLP